MAIGDVSLSSSARSNLLALQSTSKLLGQTQERLSTGKKVNSSLDGAASYFSSQGFLNSANDLSNLKDSMSTAIQTLEAATNAIDAITDIITQMQGLATSALQASDEASRVALGDQYEALGAQIDYLVDDSTFNGTNLLDGLNNDLQVFFNATNTSSLTIDSDDATSATLNIDAATGGWSTVANVKTDQSLLQTALATLRTMSSTFGSNNTILTTRQDYTSNMINTLQTASDNLILADTNEEGANLQSLQAASSLGIVALGISGEQAQAIMRLF